MPSCLSGEQKQTMITVSEARKKIIENCPKAKVSLLPLIEAIGCVLADNLYSPIDSPHFNQSAMDGYAFRFEDWDGKSALKINGKVQAGNYFTGEMNGGEAVRIFTGAALPLGADTVVIQENVTKEGDLIKISDSKLKKGSNVRLIGSQVKMREQILKEGHLLTPATLSFLAGLGFTHVLVYSKPKVSIITTGKELVKPGELLTEGKIYESNSIGLQSALEQINIKPAAIGTVDDNVEQITNTIRKQLGNVDILILTGGVSVGDYDFVTAALEKCGVQKVFHKVKQKPGKPFYFGMYGQTLVFGLPGNPSSVLTCFYEYVVDAISELTKKEYFKRIQLPLANDFSKKAGLTFFLKGKINGNSVSILNDQESYKMNSYALADCLVELEEEKEEFKKSEVVSIRIIAN